MTFKYPGKTSISEFIRVLKILNAEMIYVGGSMSMRMNDNSIIKLELI